MGSQSVTNFSAIRMENIDRLVKDYYSPKSPKSAGQAKSIGAAAVGTLTTKPAREIKPAAKGSKKRRSQGGPSGGGAAAAKGPTNEFLQALTSHRVENAINLIKTLAEEMKRAKDPEKVYEKYGITDAEPLGSVSSLLTRALSTHLGSQAETDLGFAARDAILKTIIDAVHQAFPRGPEPAKVDRKKFAETFKKLSPEKINTIFMQNAASALVNLVLDATRGTVRPERMDELKQQVRKQFIPDFIEKLKSGLMK